MGDGSLAEIKQLVDVPQLLGAGADTRIDLFELEHDRHHFLLGLDVQIQIALVGAQDHG